MEAEDRSCRGPDGDRLEGLTSTISNIQHLMMQREPVSKQLVMSHRQRNRTRNAKKRLYRKKNNIIRNAHIAYTKHINQRFAVILKPKFCPSQMVVKGRRTMTRSSVKALMNLEHYKLRMRQIDSATRAEGHRCIITEEYWTSRTCCMCGVVRPKYRGRQFDCVNPDCNITMDRDTNGARNIMIRYFCLQNPLLTVGWLRKLHSEVESEKLNLRLASLHKNKKDPCGPTVHATC